MEWIDASVVEPEFPCIACDAQRNPPFIPKGILSVNDKKRGISWYMDASLVTQAFGDMYDTVCYENRITHWMPLPELPKEK